MRFPRALLVAMLILGAAPAISQTSPTPRFRDYPAEVFSGRAAPIVLGPKDLTFRTRLREASHGRPNFAAAYVLTVWGCGTTCLMGAAIDLRSGRVVWLPAIICCWPLDVDDKFQPVAFRVDSSLLVLSGLRDEKEGDQGTHFYRLEDGRFIHVRSIAH